VSDAPARCFLVSHFHWDREWYRTFEDYRGRLVDAVDRVLDLVATDAGYRFVLDGQAVLLEDYLAVRPERRDALARGLADGRLAAGPWYVQPDVLLPSGESLIRNLLLGRAVAGALGPVARTGYVPDSFGHPAALPQILAGFGIDTFVHWRGNGDELARTGPRWRWIAPDGSGVTAMLLPDGYFNAACLPSDVERAADGLAATVARLRDAHGDPVVLMNGFDHMPPDPHTGPVAAALATRLGEPVARALLDDVTAVLPPPAVEHAGELLGARLANLLPGVWSTRMALKLANRRCETLLVGWLEPWAALGRALGLASERAALDAAWRALVQNHAHDSICGCSLDAVADRTAARFEEAEGLARATFARVLDRLAGLGPDRRTPDGLDLEIAVFNPSPHARTDVVRVPLDPYPAMRIPLGMPEFPALGLAQSQPPGFTIDGRAVRVVVSADPTRPRWLPGQTPFDVELAVADVPAFGVRRLRLEPAAPSPDVVDDGRELVAGGVRVSVAADGTLDVALGAALHRGLLALEDRGDRGDSYDCDPIDGEDARASVECTRWRHASGLGGLVVRRVLRVPRRLRPDRAGRDTEPADVVVTYEARVAPGVPRVDLRVRVENGADDHRLRLRFPTGRPVDHAIAATTFGIAVRPTAPRDDAGWVHAAPRTFPHQGWISANGLTVVAPGLPEAEVTPDGTIVVTLLRAVGWIARYDLRTRPIPAGPPMEIPGAQCPGTLEARMALIAGADPATAWDAELALAATIAGPTPLVADNQSLLAVDPPSLVLTTLKPAANGDDIIVRIHNPTDTPCTATLTVGFPLREARPVRLDEEPASHAVTHTSHRVHFEVPARALRSVRLVPR
jgi:mannosylglycerate hydrolase